MEIENTRYSYNEVAGKLLHVTAFRTNINETRAMTSISCCENEPDQYL